MKLAIVAPLVTAIREPQRGGSQAFVSDLASGLVDRGHEVHVYAASGSDIPGVRVIDTGVDPQALEATLYRAAGPATPGAAALKPAVASGPATPRAATLKPAVASGPATPEAATAEPAVGSGRTGPGLGAAEQAFSGVYAAVGEAGYDVVHNHAFDAPAVTLATALDAPVIHTVHLPPGGAVADALHSVTKLDRPPTVAVVSASQARAWRRVVPVGAVLPPYVPTRMIGWSPTAGDRALFAGRLSPEKGAAEAIEIAHAAGVGIDVYGDPYDPEYTRTQIDPRRGEPRVVVRAGIPRTALWEVMARAAVVLCPAKWEEPFGMVAAEAQACGTPVVAFRRGALAEVIIDGVTGFLVAPDDISAAADALIRARELSRSACRDHAEAQLDLERTLDAHEHLYGRVVRAGAGAGAAIGG
jgi:glycosyltransferase involved in cell wall biosynthesis